MEQLTPTVAIVVAVIAAIPPTAAAIVALVIAGRKLDHLHVQMNSRLDELVASKTAEADAAGEARGRAAERER